jgi:protoheme IX farnesyltransferase
LLQHVLGQNANLWISDYVELTKPKLSFLVVFTAFLGWCIAPGAEFGFELIKTMFIISALVGGAAAFNCFMERDLDARMDRTRERAIPSGRISANSAKWFSLTLMGSSLFLILWQVNFLTFVLGFAAAFTYLLLYTPLKRYGHFAVYVGAIPGAIPPVMGYTAVTNELSLVPVLLFSLLFVWQIPHFFAISLIHEKDFKNAGFKVYSLSFGERKTVFAIAIYTLLVVLVSMLPFLLDPSKVFNMFLAAGVNILFLGIALVGLFYLKDKSVLKIWSRLYFRATILYLPIIMICHYTVV